MSGGPRSPASRNTHTAVECVLREAGDLGRPQSELLQVDVVIGKALGSDHPTKQLPAVGPLRTVKSSWISPEAAYEDRQDGLDNAGAAGRALHETTASRSATPTTPTSADDLLGKIFDLHDQAVEATLTGLTAVATAVDDATAEVRAAPGISRHKRSA